MIFLCPTNCEHDLPFQHSIVTTTRIVRHTDGSRSEQTWTYVICRECEHWIDKPGTCYHLCHVENGTHQTVKELDMV